MKKIERTFCDWCGEETNQSNPKKVAKTMFDFPLNSRDGDWVCFECRSKLHRFIVETFFSNNTTKESMNLEQTHDLNPEIPKKA